MQSRSTITASGSLSAGADKSVSREENHSRVAPSPPQGILVRVTHVIRSAQKIDIFAGGVLSFRHGKKKRLGLLIF